MCRNAKPSVGAIEEENLDQQQQDQHQQQQQIPPSNQQSTSQASAVKQKSQQNCAVQQKHINPPCPQQNTPAEQFDHQQLSQTAEVQFAGRFLDSDSENEYNLLAVEAVESNTGVVECPAEIEEYSGVVEVNHLNEASDRNGNLKTLDAVLRAGNTFIKMLVDTGSPSSFLNRDTANTILRDAKANAKFIKFADLQLDTLYLDYNKQRILILGALQVSVTSIDWSVQNARFLVVEDNRCLLGLDLQPHLGIFTK